MAGDFCPQYRVSHKFNEGDFASVLEDMKPFIERADYSIVNFECPVTKGGEKPIVKQGPNLQCSENGIEAVKWVGFDCVTLANNHFLDYGEKGVRHTLDTCEKYGVDTVGGGMNLQEASQVLFKEINGVILAVINCCEHEFSIATENSAGSNPINLVRQYYAIQEAKGKADYVLLIVHGGNEYYQLPSPRMKEIYRFFVNAGADVVVNHHQHCFSGYELYNGKPIFYGLGNFCFDKLDNESRIWNEGFMVDICFDVTISFTIIPYIQCEDRPSVRRMNDKERCSFEESISVLNNLILNDDLLLTKYKEFIKGFESIVRVMLSPYLSRIGRGLCRRHLLPSFMSPKKKTEILGYLECESHFDKVIDYLTRL